MIVRPERNREKTLQDERNVEFLMTVNLVALFPKQLGRPRGEFLRLSRRVIPKDSPQNGRSKKNITTGF
jgi:hypothetical protein